MFIDCGAVLCGSARRNSRFPNFLPAAAAWLRIRAVGGHEASASWTRIAVLNIFRIGLPLEQNAPYVRRALCAIFSLSLSLVVNIEILIRSERSNHRHRSNRDYVARASRASSKLLLLFINDIYRTGLFVAGFIGILSASRERRNTLGKMTHANWIKFKRLNDHFISRASERANERPRMTYYGK